MKHPWEKSPSSCKAWGCKTLKSSDAREGLGHNFIKQKKYSQNGHGLLVRLSFSDGSCDIGNGKRTSRTAWPEDSLPQAKAGQLCLYQPLLFRGFWVVACQKWTLAGSVCPSHQTSHVPRDPTGRPDLQPAYNEMKKQRHWA